MKWVIDVQIVKTFQMEIEADDEDTACDLAEQTLEFTPLDELTEFTFDDVGDIRARAKATD